MVFGLVFGSVAGVFFLIVKAMNLYRDRTRLQLIHQERLAAIEKGLLTPEVADYDSIASSPRAESLLAYMRVNPRWPLGVGTLLVVGGIGMLIALILSRDPYRSYSLIPISLGVGLWLHYLVMRPRDGR